MKIRNGFVSNSSSSSFVIITKDGELTEDKLMKVFNVGDFSPVYRLVSGIASEMIDSCSELTAQQFKNNKCWENETDVEFEEQQPQNYEIYRHALDNEWKIYEGSADSCEQPTLCDLSLSYEDDTIIIEKDGGY